MPTLETDVTKRYMVTFEEQKEIIDSLDEIASQEGTKRSTIIRRAIRLLLSKPEYTPLTPQVPQTTPQR